MNHSEWQKKIQMNNRKTSYTSSKHRMTNDLTALLRKAYPQFFLPTETENDYMDEDSLFGDAAETASQQYNTLP